MTTHVIRLHEASPGNGLAATDTEQQGRLRLNLFAGRSLSEREFDVMQQYAEDRLAPLLASHAPGIVHGLELSAGQVPVPGQDSVDWLFRVRPGLAVGGDGKIINMVFPLDQFWREQIDDYRRRTLRNRIHGIYFVTVRREVEYVDHNAQQRGCVRDELDRLRDARIETVTRLGLQIIEEGDAVVAEAKNDGGKHRLINRLLAERLERPILQADGTVPVAMIAVDDNRVVWVETVAGRFMARPKAAYLTFLAHTRQAMQAHFGGLGNSESERQDAIERFNLAYLPAAGILPTLFVDDVSGSPELRWFPDHLQVELAPVAESQVEALIERELPRRSIDLERIQGDRIRLLLAINDRDYRPDLFDLPFPDRSLEKELYRYGRKAFDSWGQWLLQYERLFHGLTADDLTSEVGSRLFQVPERIDTEAEGAPIDPPTFFNRRIAAAASWETRKVDINQGLPAPYTTRIPAPPDDAGVDYAHWQSPQIANTPGLLKRYLTVEQDIDNAERMMEDLAELLALYNDMQRAQRQQIDHVSLAFTRLAGGVPGDGTGLAVARWLPNIKFATKQSGDGG